MIFLYVTIAIAVVIIMVVLIVLGIKLMFPKILQNANDQLITMAKEKLESERQIIGVDLANKKSSFEDLVENIRKELDSSKSKLETAEKERVGSFRELKTELENQRRVSEQLSTTTEGLNKVLANNQLRGQFGEQVAEDLLRMTGFVNGVDYLYNKAQAGSGNRPDFTVLLPDGVKVNVDVKFPLSNFQRYIESEDKEAKGRYLKGFKSDIEDKIKQVTSRDYISPQDNTVDFVIMFIPNEMIFSFIYENMDDVWKEAMAKKVILAGPFSFTATLRLIRQSYANFKIQNNFHRIVELIVEFNNEWGKYSEEFDKIGDRLKSLSEQYQKVETTRSNKLLKTIEKIKNEEPPSLPAIQAPEDSE